MTSAIYRLQIVSKKRSSHKSKQQLKWVSCSVWCVVTKSHLPVNVFIHAQYEFRWNLTLMRSSFQNVNIHRTPEDALQTVPAHFWPPADCNPVRLQSCSSHSLFDGLLPVGCFTFSSPHSLLTVVTVWVMCLVLLLKHLCHTHTHTSVTHVYLFDLSVTDLQDLKELNLNTWICVGPQCSYLKAMLYMYRYIFK